MKRAANILVLTLAFGAGSALVKAQATSGQAPTITLYSRIKYTDARSDLCFNLDAGELIPEGRRCDIYYGTLRAGEDFDWFQSGTTTVNRSKIRDLGPYSWTDGFTVPVIEPFPKLKPGETRPVIVDTSGADGADGLPGKPAVNGDGTLQRPIVVDRPSRAKNDGTPKIDPIFAKAIVGHMYVIHVIDQTADFYALFRVESLERGDKCTISWRKILAPEEQAEKMVKQ